MAYPYSKAGGGISSVAWGDITGTLSAQSDLNSALAGKIEGVAWGAITGTLASQTDLQAALDAKQDVPPPTLVPTDYTNNTYWQKSAYSNEMVAWSGSAWVPDTYVNTDTSYELRPVGGFTTGMRPPRIDITFNSMGPESGVYTGMIVTVWDSSYNTIATASIPFTAWNESIKVELATSFDSAGDIYYINVSNIGTDGVSPTITAIEFLFPE